MVAALRNAVHAPFILMAILSGLACYLFQRSESAKVTTIEGLSENGDHPVQKAWDEVDVPQCGYCQAGQIMTAAAFLKRNPKPTAATN